MKCSTISVVFILCGSALVAAGPFALIPSILGRVAVSVATRVGSTVGRAAKSVSRVGRAGKKAAEAHDKVKQEREKRKQKKGKRDWIYDADEFDSMLVARDRSIQDWVDMIYDPAGGTGISKEVLGLLSELGRNPPAPGVSCPTKTNQIPQFRHAPPISENKAIPRDASVQMLKWMLTRQAPAEKVLFASLEVAMHLNCWTIPPDVKMVVDRKGWIQQIEGAQPAKPARRSVEGNDLDVDLDKRDILDSELIARGADQEHDFGNDLWMREADEDDEVELSSRDIDFDLDWSLASLYERDNDLFY